MRLIDADAIPYKKIMFDDDEDDFYYGVTQPYIDRMPTIDAVPVVRCRECRYFCKGENDAESWEWCDAWKKDCWSDCYCSQGRRREDGDGDG